MRTWDLSSGHEVRSRPAQPGGTLAFLNDGRLITGWGRVLDPRPLDRENRIEADALGLVRRLIRLPRSRGVLKEDIRSDTRLGARVRERVLAIVDSLLED